MCFYLVLLVVSESKFFIVETYDILLLFMTAMTMQTRLTGVYSEI